MTSGPGTKVGVSNPHHIAGGMAIDLGSPLTSWSISIGCIAAPIEILPTAFDVCRPAERGGKLF
jgi:hypothetical protein